MSGAPPLIDYPTHYVFKALGPAAPDFAQRVRALVEGVLGQLRDEALVLRPSSGGKYLSVSVHVYLETEDHRRRIYQAFHGEKAILWYV